MIQEIEEKTRAGDALTLTMDDLESSPGDTDSKPSDGRIILDDIDWDVISAQHGTRAAPQCLTKWYTQLAPSMVSKGNMINLLLHHHSTCVVFHISGGSASKGRDDNSLHLYLRVLSEACKVSMLSYLGHTCFAGCSVPSCM